MKQYFKADSYVTPAQIKRYFMDRVMCDSRWWFYFKYLQTVFKYRPHALRGEYDDDMWAQSSIDMHKITERCGGKIHIEGLDNLRQEQEPMVIVGNHMSTAESQLLPGIIEPIKHVTFVVKESLVKAKIWEPIMRARAPIVVSRRDPKQDMMEVLEKGKQLLEKGRSVFIFPQSTRSIKFIPEEFNSLGIKLARKAKVKIMPVALKTDFWGNGKLARAFGPIRRDREIHFRFGQARQVEGTGKAQHEEIIEFIRSSLRNWGHAG